MLVRNTHFWRAGRPYLDGVKLTYVPDDTTRVLQVRSGQANVAEAVPFSQIADLSKASGVTVQVAPIVSYDGIFLNEKYAPLADQKVRQALNYALDKNRINTAIYAGKAQVANSTIAKTQYWSSTRAGVRVRPGEGEEADVGVEVPEGLQSQPEASLREIRCTRAWP